MLKSVCATVSCPLSVFLSGNGYKIGVGKNSDAQVEKFFMKI